VSTDNQPQQLRIVSQAQFGFFNNRLNYMGEHGLDTDPETGIDRQTIMQALQGVKYADLPPKAGRSASTAWKPKAQPQAPAPRVKTIKSGSKVACYLVRKPGPMFFISSPKVWEELKAAMPDLTRAHVMTLQEARTYLEFDGTKVRSLKEAGELWASDCPAEPTMKQPQAADKQWVDDENPFACYGDEDDENVFEV
jgi:hypothetical protein